MTAKAEDVTLTPTPPFVRIITPAPEVPPDFTPEKSPHWETIGRIAVGGVAIILVLGGVLAAIRERDRALAARDSMLAGLNRFDVWYRATIRPRISVTASEAWRRILRRPPPLP